MLAIRFSKLVLVISATLMAALPGINNLIDYQINFEYVQHVMMMDSHQVAGKTASRAIHQEWVHHLTYISIIATELAIAVLGLWGAWDMANALKDAKRFHRSKSKAIWAMTLGLAVWLFGFLVIGSEWFLMWLSQEYNAQQVAFRMSVIFILGLLFLSMKDGESS